MQQSSDVEHGTFQRAHLPIKIIKQSIYGWVPCAADGVKDKNFILPAGEWGGRGCRAEHTGCGAPSILVVSDLQPSTDYVFRLRSANQEGQFDNPGPEVIFRTKALPKDFFSKWLRRKMALKDRVALLALHHAAAGSAWNSNNWDTDSPISQWHGVTVAEDRVAKLGLMSNNLQGPIPKELGNLTQLKELVLYNNNLTGVIPAQLGALHKLTWLHLSNNQLSGPIPRQLGDLSALEALDLSFNKLDGHIPKELGALTNLEQVWLQRNQLTGAIPAQLGALNKVTRLNLSNNQLSGKIPQQLGNMSALQILNLSRNNLDGSIPKELGDLSELRELWLSFNQLTGHIPKELGALSQLERLYLLENQLAGPIPPELAKLAALERLDLTVNQLTGPIPKELGNLTALTTLELQNNSLEGPIPKELGNLKALTILRLGNNSLEGGVPAAVRNLGALITSDFGLIERQGSVDRSKDAGTGHPLAVGGRSSESADDSRTSMDCIPQATAVQEPNERRMRGAVGQGTARKVTIVENLDSKDTPWVGKGRGVLVSVPRNAHWAFDWGFYHDIGPITVEEAAEVVKGSDDSVWVVLQAVHCRPAGTTFLEPLTLDFAVKDGHVRWWDRAAVRKDVLREYQILSKQSEDDPWKEMDVQDVSVVWDDQDSTCLRARIRHFTWFSVARRTTSASGNVVSRHWDKSVLVVNATNSVAHVTPMAISFTTSKEATKACSLTFSEAGISFEAGRRTEQIMLPVNTSSEIIPAGGAAELFLSGGAREMKVIVCYLPDRSKAEVSSSNQTVSPSSGTSPVPRTTSSPVIQTTATGTRQGTSMIPQTSTAASPSSGGSTPLGAGSLVRVTSPTSEVAAPQSGGQGTSPRESEEMVYSMTKVLPGRRRLTLLQASVNRKINIEQNARALETYAMMLADFGTAPP